jgi:integrase
MAKKRGHGQGSVTRRPNGKWLAQVLIGGRRLSHTAETKREAERWIRETLLKAEQGLLPAEAGRVTVGQFLDRWLEAKAPALRPKTLEYYRDFVRLYLKPVLGGLRLWDLRPDHLQALYADMLKRGLKPATVRLRHATIRTALNDALRWGLAARNVAQAVRPPRPERREMKTWTPEEARRFLEAVAGSRLEAAYRLALCCGLRLGELAGLKWEDIDLEPASLQVRRTLLWTGRLGGEDGVFYGEPKTARGRRQVELPAQVVEALRRRRQLAQKEERLLAGPRWQESGHVFTTLQGKPLDPRIIQKDFAEWVRKAGLPRIRFHDLRHTCATLLLSQGVHPKVVQELLGHSQISVTLDTYSHVLPTLQAQAARAMEVLL